MYNCNLNIIIYSDDLLLETEMKDVCPLERFKHTFQTNNKLIFENLDTADIIIFDVVSSINLKKIRQKMKSDAFLILCSNSSNINDYSGIDDIWVKPFSPDFIAFSFIKILKLIKTNKDYSLNQLYLDTAIDSIPDLIWFKDLKGEHFKVNNGFCNAVGKTKQDIAGRGHYYIWDLKKEEYESGEYVCLETDEIVHNAKKTCLFDEKVKSKHGLRQLKTYKSPLILDGKMLGTVGIAHDITDLQNMGAELEIILRSMPFAIVVRNQDGIIINANDKFEKYFKVDKEYIIGKLCYEWKFQTLKNISKVNSEGYLDATAVIDGKDKIFEIHEEPILDVFNNVVGQLCICRDVTIERTLENKILNNSNTDFMTGLYNRRYFYEYINDNRSTNPISLLYVDLDNFKKINDTFGHKVGDETLITASQIIKECFPHEFIARLGGDEFLIALIGEYSINFLENKATELINCIISSFQATEKLNIISASVGIAQSYDSNIAIDELLHQSDIALYQAKQNGKCQYKIYK